MNAKTHTKRITCLACGYSWDVQIPEGYSAIVNEETGYPVVKKMTTGEFITFKCPVCKVTMDRLRWS